MFHLKCVVNVWPLIFLCHLAVILTQPLEEEAIASIATKNQTHDKLSDDFNKHYHVDNNNTASDVFHKFHNSRRGKGKVR
ncbi:hypothetical protein DOY81_005946 [Sarcophaga bullata]|nr:hypothetical protein DOY81_005946 [Sarcophaga bullata]